MSVEGPRPYQPEPVDHARERWKYRRIMIFGAAGLLAVLLLVLAFVGDATKFGSAIWAFVSLVGLYLGAPIADDALQLRAPRPA